MFNKIQEFQQKAKELKERLNDMTVSGKSLNGEITVTCNANRKVVAINIDEKQLNTENVGNLQELLVFAVNNAIEQAEQVAQAETKAIMPKIPGLGL